MPVRTIIEPFRIKMVEPIRMTTREERQVILERAGYNPFLIPAEDVLLDLLTDSGTSAMSSEQWAAMMRGDESYAGAKSFHRFADVVKRLTGLGHVIPTHQGRAAERILFGIVGGAGKIVPNNTHFDTTRANIEHVGSEAVDLVAPEGLDPAAPGDFKGNMDVQALERLIERVGADRIPLVMITVTNNAAGGQPVSMGNIRAVRAVCDRHRLPLFLDAARFAENCWFIREREPGYQQRSLREVAREMFSLCDGLTMSAKKDALVNIGGFLAMNDGDLADRCRSLLILTEGFPTYGGLAGRDLEAMAQGLEEVLDEDYMRYRIRSVAFLGEHLLAQGVPIFEPPGGHAIYLDARRFLPHIPPEQFPGQALVAELFLEGGIRCVEVGSVMFGHRGADGVFRPARNELVRLAIPRRVYTQSHIEYLIEVILEVFQHRDRIRGLRFRRETKVLRHFTSTFEPVT